MRSIFRRRPSPAMAVAFVALFVALAGVAVSAPSRINGNRIVNRTIAALKLKNNTLTAQQINEGALGVVPKAATVTPVRTVRAFSSSAKVEGDTRTATAKCPSGTKVVGGGAGWTLPGSTGMTNVDAEIGSSRPSPASSGSNNQTSWKAQGQLEQNTAQARTLMAVALCVNR